MSIFKACDIRGRYGQNLTPEVALRLGLAIGTETTGRPVVVGGDVRPSTAPLKEALIRGLMAAGSHVLDVGVLPTPAFYFAKDHLGVEAGVMVTGSHNPPGDNGFKVSLSPWSATAEELASLENRMTRGDFAQGTGSYQRVGVIEPYMAFVKSRFPASDGLKVVVDAGNGCYAAIAPAVLRDRGYDVVELFCEPDGTFPNRNPNPAVASNLKALCETVVQSGADLGIAFDGDGDRAVFVDGRGHAVGSDRSLVIFALYLLRRGPGEVVHDIKCSSIVPEEVRKAGGTPVMEKSGHAFIRNTLLRRKAVMGGEISGHFFFGELGRDDGLYAALLMLRILTETGQRLADLNDTIPSYPITPDIRLPCPLQEAEATVREVMAAFAQDTGSEISTLDGVRVAWPDGWALIRPSVTEALLTLRFEAHSAVRLAEIQEMVAARSPRLRAKMGKS
ncbi:MAG: phosphomannomutase/phosphoglucomutase [Anaerolineae bacterium]|nr:phosphomannomutase/phosphoglucomutase [Anaerolineae bacterium]